MPRACPCAVPRRLVLTSAKHGQARGTRVGEARAMELCWPLQTTRFNTLSLGNATIRLMGVVGGATVGGIMFALVARVNPGEIRFPLIGCGTGLGAFLGFTIAQKQDFGGKSRCETSKTRTPQTSTGHPCQPDRNRRGRHSVGSGRRADSPVDVHGECSRHDDRRNACSRDELWDSLL